MAVYGILGEQGTGKSATQTYFGVQAAASGQRVVTMMPMYNVIKCKVCESVGMPKHRVLHRVMCECAVKDKDLFCKHIVDDNLVLDFSNRLIYCPTAKSVTKYSEKLHGPATHFKWEFMPQSAFLNLFESSKDPGAAAVGDYWWSKLHDATLLMDESQQIGNDSRRAMSNEAHIFNNFLTSARKLKLDVFWSQLSSSRVLKDASSVTNWMVYPQKYKTGKIVADIQDNLTPPFDNKDRVVFNAKYYGRFFATEAIQQRPIAIRIKNKR